MNDRIYFRADSLEIAVNIAVGEAQHGRPNGFDGGGAGFVAGVSFRGKMLGAIQLDDQFGFLAVEIRDELADGLLPLEAWCVAAQEVIPEVVFRGVAFLRGALARGMRFLL